MVGFQTSLEAAQSQTKQEPPSGAGGGLTVSNVLRSPKPTTKKHLRLGTFLESHQRAHPTTGEASVADRSVASALGTRSVMTASTSSSWRRRNRTGKDRRSRAKDAHTSSNAGWLESMQKAAADGKIPYHTWNP